MSVSVSKRTPRTEAASLKDLPADQLPTIFNEILRTHKAEVDRLKHNYELGMANLIEAHEKELAAAKMVQDFLEKDNKAMYLAECAAAVHENDTAAAKDMIHTCCRALDLEKAAVLEHYIDII